MNSESSRRAVHAVLQSEFGFDSLRPGQQPVIENVLASQDTLAIMPTGSGKSLTYQLSAALLPGVTVVISPLIALMKDQVDSLPASLRRQTRLINSTLSTAEMSEALSRLQRGELRMVYVAPERLRDRRFLRALAGADVSLVVVDEAHCISLWGQDYRPDYLFIPKAIDAIGQPAVLAVTATATPAMARQIEEGLRRQLEIERVSLFRPNLDYRVEHLRNRSAKIERMLAICKKAPGSDIVYVNSRDDTEHFAALLRDRGVQARHYHAGMDPRNRAETQERFMSGDLRVVVATIAFGMGVDKADVRFIVNFNPPTSLEAYAQESGRAGRDGKSAQCVLFATGSDRGRLRSFANREAISTDALRTIFRRLTRNGTGKWALLDRDVIDRIGDEDFDARIGLGLLEQAGLVSRHADVPRTITLSKSNTGADTSTGEMKRVIDAVGGTYDGRNARIDVAGVCDQLDLTPVDLDQAISLQQEWRAADGPRATCIEILPAGPDAAERVDTLLERLEFENDRRIDAVLGYAGSHECRHVVLARQFGETIETCGKFCDNCRNPHQPRESSQEPEPTRRTVTVPDLLAVLNTVDKLPYQMGKTGLDRYLTGSVESRVRRDEAPDFGILADIQQSVIGRMIDALVEEGLLHRDFEHEYKIITKTDAGKRPNRETLDVIAERVAPKSRSEKNPIELDGQEKQLYEKLATWRVEKTQRESVPAYVIAHNSMLVNVAIRKPTSKSELQKLQGFGPKKVDHYGDEIVEIVKQFVNR